MKQWTYSKEIQILLEQFTSAFNDIIIKRSNATGGLSEHKVNFVYAPKQRIFNSLTNPAPGGITVPAVCINIGSIQRDNDRGINKGWGFNIETGFPGVSSTDFVRRIKNPVPINIGVNMTLITKYQSDMDQIISNFVPYCDPYIVISWKLPVSYNRDYEIRTEILWSGNINLSYPTELQGNQAYRVTADTSFTIKGWLFKSNDLNENYKKIYVINTDFVAVNEDDINSCKLITDLEDYQTDFVSISARPQLRWSSPLSIQTHRTQDLIDPPIIEILGKQFIETRNLYISASDPSAFEVAEEFFNPFADYPLQLSSYPGFYGYKIPEFTVHSPNYLSFALPYIINKNCLIDVIIENEAGYGSLVLDTTHVIQTLSADYISPVADGINLNEPPIFSLSSLSGSSYIEPIFGTEPQLDSDSDGYTDIAELSAGTDPNDSLSFPSSLFDVYNNL